MHRAGITQFVLFCVVLIVLLILHRHFPALNHGLGIGLFGLWLVLGIVLRRSSSRTRNSAKRTLKPVRPSSEFT
jgi:preprotein translocase subunit SecG